MLRCFVFGLLMAHAASLCSQSPYNLGFENHLTLRTNFRPWYSYGERYEASLDSVSPHSGRYCLRFEQVSTTGLTYGGINFVFPATFEGDQVELRAWMRSEGVAPNTSGIRLRMEDGNGTVLTFRRYGGYILKSTSQWTQYSISLDMPLSTDSVIAGLVMESAGTIWIDDAEIFVNGKPLHKARPRALPVFPAEADNSIEKGTGIDSLPRDAASLLSMEILGKVWGLVKYHHPSVARGEYNLDAVLVRLLPEVLHAPTADARNAVLLRWVRSLGPFGTGKPPGKKNLRLAPDHAWIRPETLGSELAELLTDLSHAKREDSHFYVWNEEGINRFMNESDYYLAEEMDAGLRLIALYRFWNLIQYYYPYRALTEVPWADALRLHLPDFISAQNDWEYERALSALIARCNDANATGFFSEIYDSVGHNDAAVQSRFLDGLPVVTAYYEQELGKTSGLQPGDVILSVNGRPVKEIEAEWLPCLPGGNPHTRRNSLSEMLLRSDDSVITVAIKRGESILSQAVPVYGIDVFFPWIHRTDTCFRMLDGDIAYLFPHTLNGDDLPALMPHILGSKGLIVDLRAYPKDQGMAFHLLSDSLFARKTAVFTQSEMDAQVPGRVITTGDFSRGRRNPHPYSGRIIVLVDERTHGAAERMAMSFGSVPGARVIGSPTAGALGFAGSITLPGVTDVGITLDGFRYADGREVHGRGLFLDECVWPSPAGIAAGRDEVLERAVQLLREN